MQWNEIVLIAGVCAAFAGGIASLFFTSRRLREWRRRESTTHLTITNRLESMGELCAVALFWAGIVLVELGIIANQIERGTSHQRLAFSLVAGALSLLVCGAALGRLSLRWQLQPPTASDGRPDGARA